LVFFVNLAPNGDDNWPEFVNTLLETCAINARDQARFSQTGVGWLLQELSKTEPDKVTAFVEQNTLSKEARRMVLAKITGRGRW
jgi:3-methyladenine DNA glycosylase AlkD